jgi:hypothetical protein
MPKMRSRLRHFIVGVLLVLLPLQASAVVTICPHAGSMAVAQAAPASDQGIEHCLHDRAGDPTQNTDQGGQSSSSCCASTTACAMCSIAVNVRQFPMLVSPLQVSVNFLSAQFTSFIPEGLQRPPSIPA